MKSFVRLASTAVLAAALVGAFAAPALADSGGHDHYDFDHSRGADHAVFVQTDNTAGNQVVAYHRSDSGTLTPPVRTTPRVSAARSPAPWSTAPRPRASLTYDAAHSLLFAVNAGSNTVSVFSVAGRPTRPGARSSTRAATFPVSVAVHDTLVYVLNARSGGSVSGYHVFVDRLFPI